MKYKIYSSLIAPALCMMLASCVNTNKTDADSFLVSDVEVTEQTIVIRGDTCDAVCVENDSIVSRGGTTNEGFGRCSKCNCKSFEGCGQTCGNCGHVYKAHY